MSGTGHRGAKSPRNLALPGQRQRRPADLGCQADQSPAGGAVADIPAFLSLPERSVKPRTRGITHVLDSGLTPVETRSFMEQAGHLADIVKVG
ncbi:MAG: phosphosulfolactate synthase, partial [Actinomycetota bacterium]|nr:phosphosulfolactate synthase [Actinomycetota bacterium]